MFKKRQAPAASQRTPTSPVAAVFRLRQEQQPNTSSMTSPSVNAQQSLAVPDRPVGTGPSGVPTTEIVTNPVAPNKLGVSRLSHKRSRKVSKDQEKAPKEAPANRKLPWPLNRISRRIKKWQEGPVGWQLLAAFIVGSFSTLGISWLLNRVGIYPAIKPMLICWAVMILAVLTGIRWYMDGMEQARNEYAFDPADERLDIQNLQISEADFNKRLRGRLYNSKDVKLPEKYKDSKIQVLWVARFHRFKLYPRVILVAIGALAVTAAIWAIPAIGLPVSIWVLIVIWLLSLLGLAGMLAFEWMLWHCEYLVVTNLFVALPRSLPVFFWWMKSPMPTVFIRQINSSDPDDTTLGRRYGYGIIDVITVKEADPKGIFREMGYVSQHKVVARIIFGAIGRLVEAVPNV